MMKFLFKSSLISFLMVLFFSINVNSQNNNFEAKITTMKGESYHLVNLRGYGGFEFQCKNKKAEFNVKFDKIKTVNFDKKRKKQFRKATILLENGQMNELYIKDSFKEEGYKPKYILLTIEGNSKEYGSLIRLNIRDIKKINFIN